MGIPQKAKADEQVTLQLKVQTELGEYVVVSKGLGKWPHDKSDFLIMSSKLSNSHSDNIKYTW